MESNNKAVNRRATTLRNVSIGVEVELGTDNVTPYKGLYTLLDWNQLPKDHALRHESIVELFNCGILLPLRKYSDDYSANDDSYIAVPSDVRVVPKSNYLAVDESKSTRFDNIAQHVDTKKSPTTSSTPHSYNVNETNVYKPNTELKLLSDSITPMGRGIQSGSICTFLYRIKGNESLIKVSYENEAFSVHESLLTSSI